MDVLDKVKGHKIYAQMDLLAGFWQGELEESCRHLTAFITHMGVFQFCRMSMGLTGCPPHFQMGMDMVMEPVKDCCEAFIDDLVLWGDSVPEFLTNLRRTFLQLRKWSLTLKPAKCVFGMERFELLGHIVDADGVTLSARRREALRSVKPPTDKKTLRSFLGLAGYFRRFIPSFSEMVKPLSCMIGSKVNFHWGKLEQATFLRIRSAVINAPVLAHIDYSRTIYIRTDASEIGIGGVLYQIKDGEEMPVEYISKSFSQTERRWSTIEQEAFAVYYAITQWQCYLQGQEFVVETDHRNLMYLSRTTTPKLVRWWLRLQAFRFKVVHIPGKMNKVADGLSRCCALTGSQLKYFSRVHGGPMGHRGVSETLRLVEQEMRASGVDPVKDWPTRRTDLADAVRNCPICQKTRPGKRSLVGIAKLEAPEPWHSVEIDTLGPFPTTIDGYTHVLAVIDRFTRFIELIAVKGVSAIETASGILGVVGRYGLPMYIYHDGGPEFVNHLVVELLRLMGVVDVTTLAHRPQSHGHVERSNRETLKHLRGFVLSGSDPKGWVRLLPLAQRIINTTKSSTTGWCPAEMMFGQRVNPDRCLLREPVDYSIESPTLREYMDRLVEDLQHINMHAQAVQEGDRKHRRRVTFSKAEAEFPVGSWVLVDWPDRPPTKLHAPVRGPFQIIRHVNPVVVRVRDPVKGEQMEFHVDGLRKFVDKDEELDEDDMINLRAGDLHDEWRVEMIVDHRMPSKGKKSTYQFRVRWKDFDEKDDSWLPYSEVKDLEALDAYLVMHPELQL